MPLHANYSSHTSNNQNTIGITYLNISLLLWHIYQGLRLLKQWGHWTCGIWLLHSTCANDVWESPARTIGCSACRAGQTCHGRGRTSLRTRPLLEAQIVSKCTHDKVYIGRAGMQVHGCGLLANLACIRANKTAIMGAGGVRVVVEAMSAHI